MNSINRVSNNDFLSFSKSSLETFSTETQSAHKIDQLKKEMLTNIAEVDHRTRGHINRTIVPMSVNFISSSEEKTNSQIDTPKNHSKTPDEEDAYFSELKSDNLQSPNNQQEVNLEEVADGDGLNFEDFDLDDLDDLELIEASTLENVEEDRKELAESLKQEKASGIKLEVGKTEVKTGDTEVKTGDTEAKAAKTKEVIDEKIAVEVEEVVSTVVEEKGIKQALTSDTVKEKQVHVGQINTLSVEDSRVQEIFKHVYRFDGDLTKDACTFTLVLGDLDKADQAFKSSSFLQIDKDSKSAFVPRLHEIPEGTEIKIEGEVFTVVHMTEDQEKSLRAHWDTHFKAQTTMIEENKEKKPELGKKKTEYTGTESSEMPLQSRKEKETSRSNKNNGINANIHINELAKAEIDKKKKIAQNNEIENETSSIEARNTRIFKNRIKENMIKSDLLKKLMFHENLESQYPLKRSVAIIPTLVGKRLL